MRAEASRGRRSSAAIAARSSAGMAVLALATSTALAAGSSASVELARALPGMPDALASKVLSVDVATLKSATADCEGKDDASPSAEAIEACRKVIEGRWSKAVLDQLGPTLDEQARKILELRSDNGAALEKLMKLIEARESDIADGLAAKAKELAAQLPKPSSKLSEWIGDDTAKKLPQEFSDVVKESSAKQNPGLLSEVAGSRPSDSEQLAELKEMRDKYLAAAESQYSRSVTCTWADSQEPGSRLTCDKSLLVSGEEVSDIYIQGIPSTKALTVTARLSEQRYVAAGLGVPQGDERVLAARFGLAELPRLDYQESTFKPGDARPVVIEVHTDRWFGPTHGGGSRNLRRRSANYWTRVVTDLRKGGKLALVTKGQAARLFIKVTLDDSSESETVALELGYARWKFETAGFIGASKLVDEAARTHVKDGDSNTVVVDSIDQVDNFGIETGVLLTFVPQNYQAIGMSLGFATNQGRAQSMYLGASLRVRTFGQRGLASLGVGALIKSVTRFPHLAPGEYPSDSELLKGRNEFLARPAVLFSLGFGFGPISGPKEAQE